MFNLATVVLSWFLVVTVTGQEVQKSDPMTEEACLDLRDQYRAYVIGLARDTGLVQFRDDVISLADVDMECVRDTKGDT